MSDKRSKSEQVKKQPCVQKENILAVPAKKRHEIKLREYLCNPENNILSNRKLATVVLGFARPGTLYVHFTADELRTIIDECLQERRKRYSPQLSRIDQKLLDRAEKEGDAKEVKLCYQRFENWSEKSTVQHGFDAATLNIILSALPDEYAEAVKAQLSEIIKK